MIERYMAEATDAASPVKTPSPDRWSTMMVRRLSPLAWKRFIPPESQTASPVQLEDTEVQDKCFAVLGYLEEYYRPAVSVPIEVKDVNLTEAAMPGTAKVVIDEEGKPILDAERRWQVVESKPRHKGGLEQLEEQLDSVLQITPTADVNRPNEEQHQTQVSERLSELLANPQVRERFEAEFNAELPHYQAARGPMRQVRDIDRVLGKLRQAIYKRYLGDKQQHGKLNQSSVEQIHLFQGKLDELEEQREGIVDTVSPTALGYLETQKILDYKRQLREKGFVMTPSREHLIDRISREAMAGKKIFLVGSTGTGKTQLAFYALNNLTGGYELINWHEGTTPRDLFGYRELWTDELGGVQSGMKPQAIPKALERGVGVIHEEYTGGSTRTQLAAKFMMGARPGDKIQIPGFNGQVFDVTNNFIEVFTGNPKDEKTKQREDMDPAILRELTGVEVSYMSAPEMNDIIRAMLIEENGVLKLSRSEVYYVEQLTKAAEMMQKVHNREFDDWLDKQNDTLQTNEMKAKMRTALGLDSQGNTDNTLNTNFLDPGTLFKLFSEWELASARGTNFADYMNDKLREFITDPKTLSVPEERRTLQKILHAFGLITNATASDFRVEIPEQEKGYILPSEMAGNVVLSSENPMADANKGGRRKEAPPTGLESQEQRAWQDILGTQVDVVPLPEYITPEVIRNLKDAGMELRYIPALDLKQADLQSKDVADYLQELATLYPNWKPYESLSDADKKKHTVVRNIRAWFWEQVKAAGSNNKVGIDFPVLPGRWMAVETMEKPIYGGKYPDSPLTTRMSLTDRFNVSWNSGKAHISTIKDDFLRDIGVVGNKADMRYLTAVEWNLMANREGWGEADTYEWVEDEYRPPDGSSSRVLVGSSAYGGAASAAWDLPGDSAPRIGVRLAVILEP